MKFKLKAPFEPTGDQPKAIEELVNGLNIGRKQQTLLGVTGSGKTFTMANIINRVQKPTLIIAHNKTLAAQLASEFKEFFPNNIVEYFVSYYDYYQPEAYVPGSDTYIEKDASINEEIDKLRHSATAALTERKDVIIVASVSCIYSLGDPLDYKNLLISLRPGMEKDRDEIIKKLVEIQYDRNDINFVRGTFRVRGDVLEIFPSNSSTNALRVEFFGDEIDRITEVNALTGEIIGRLKHGLIFPASHFATSQSKMEPAILKISNELENRLKELRAENKLLEAQRLEQRTRYDLEMLKEMGFCSGIENYSMHISGRNENTRPFTLFDYFPKDFLLFIDESHVTVPQIGAMYLGDKARKTTLVDYGFRLPSALQNRPLKFNEFETMINQVIYVSATPGKYEKANEEFIAEQIIRPTGLLDPIIELRKTDGQIENLLGEIKLQIKKGHRTLVTTLTKRMSEDLTDYFKEMNLKVAYLHSDVKTIERMKIIRDLRLGVYDILIGINLLREGLDLPEVSLIAILDADKEGFLRSETSMIQTIGRAARNSEGRVIMYADKVTGSMQRAMDETARRRQIQMKYNRDNDIEPTTIKKDIYKIIESTVAEDGENYKINKNNRDKVEIEKEIAQREFEMFRAAEELKFERAAELRDEIALLKSELR
jgi:excinuclease ABC subunit B